MAIRVWIYRICCHVQRLKSRRVQLRNEDFCVKFGHEFLNHVQNENYILLGIYAYKDEVSSTENMRLFQLAHSCTYTVTYSL